MGGKGFLEKGFRNGQLVIPSAESWLLGEEEEEEEEEVRWGKSAKAIS